MRKQHREPTDTIKKQILAASGNQCAYEACSAIIVDRTHGVLVGKIAHIKARSKGGKRFCLNQTEEENRSAANLIALCGKHHDIVDARSDIYTVERLTAMKTEHEDKVENSADRSWLRFPNSIVGNIDGLGPIQVHYWIDRTDRAQVYTDRKLAIARTAFNVYLDISRMCQLYKMTEDNPEAPGNSLMQSYVRLDKDDAALDDKTSWTPITQIICQMAEIPEVTFGEFVTYLVEIGDATSLFVNRAAVLNEKIRKIRISSANST